VQSAEGIGSKFAFYVKCRRSTRRRGSAKTSPSARASDVVAHGVLLVEDNLLNQKVLAKQLRKAGCTVHVANHGGEAVDFILRANGAAPEYSPIGTQAAAAKVDCVLMDWEMPVLDGLAATRRLRELEHEGVVKERQLIIGTTANARGEQIQAAMQSGMDDVVVKPFRVPDLLVKMKDLLAAKS
jgi:CheY-like chemotaxis protein